MNNVQMPGAGGLPPEFQQQLADLQRKKTMAEMLKMQGMQQPQGKMVGNHYVASSPLAGLLPALQQWKGNMLESEYNKGSQKVGQEYQQALQNELKAYQEAAKVNPFEAAQANLANPYTGQIAKADYERLQKAMMPKTVGSELVQITPDQQVKSLYNAGPQYGDTEVVFTDQEGNPRYGQVDQRTGKKQVYGGQGSGVTVNTGDSPWDKKFAERVSKRLDESYDTTQSTVNAARSLEAAQQDLNRGIRSGMGADIQLGMAKAYSLLSGTPLNEIDVNTETFNNNMKRQVAAIAKSVFTGVMTDPDRQFLEDMSGANPKLDAQSVSRLLSLTKADAYNKLLEHQKLIDRARSNPKLGADIDADFWMLELPEIGEEPGEDGVYFDKKSGYYRVKPPSPRQTSAEEPQWLQGVKPVGVNSEGKPRYRLDDLERAQRR